MARSIPFSRAHAGAARSPAPGLPPQVYQVSDGVMAMAVTSVDGPTGEMSGVFVSEQLSDTDMGAKAPKKARRSPPTPPRAVRVQSHRVPSHRAASGRLVQESRPDSERFRLRVTSAAESPPSGHTLSH
jgi:hypothetical protein